MRYLIGTDEAGYGPNLGPLVISATVWQVPDNVCGDELYERLARVICRTPREATANGSLRVAIADSKVLYAPGAGLRYLERGLWAALALLSRQPTTWADVWQALAPDAAADLRTIPWYADYCSPVPLDADPADIEPLSAALRAGLADAGIQLRQLRSRAIFPQRFNELLGRHESKGAALSNLTLELVGQMIKRLEPGSVFVVCDKHGGRNRYAQLLAEHFPDWLIEVHGESRQRSVYRFGPAERRTEFRFQMKAEACLSVALASMASKYLRELAMRALNDFWRRRLTGLRPTAGYPSDARRFKTDIAAVQAELQIDERVLWRAK
jgi:ribonuclease HII